MDIKKTEQAKSDGQFGKRKENYEKMTYLANVNEPTECVMLLKRLNQMIDTLYKLSDDYYRDYIFNQSTTILNELEKNGFNEDYFMNLAYRMEKLRGILYREALDYDALYQAMQDEVMAYEAYWHSHFRQRTEELEYENKKLKEKESENA